MHYILLFCFLFCLILIYFKIADKYNIVDKPNERSAHTEVTLRGGGIIFWFAALFLLFQNSFENSLFFIGITIVSLVSFWDDIKSLPNKVRILAHFTAISLIFYHLGIFNLLPVYIIIAAYILSIGIINAYNFMDGINGITGCYTLAVLGSFWYVNQYIIHFEKDDFMLYPIIASGVFLFFNFRKKATCFAGDIGSISIAFWIIYLFIELIITSNSIIWILFLAVYGTDTICTILHRLYLKENIFKAHRLHFYQILCNDYKLSHRLVAVLYAIIQGIVSILVITSYKKIENITLFMLVLIPLIVLYSLKFYLIHKKNKSH
jgi:UDP-N-acetylmuramyl pentapeptide phosphotransferase/UDP-N-acetylglucosamine-1-phosphate transferase